MEKGLENNFRNVSIHLMEVTYNDDPG